MANIENINLNGVNNKIVDSTSHSDTFGNTVDISSYTSSNQYTCPSDGYFLVQPSDTVGHEVVGVVNGSPLLACVTSTANEPPIASLYVRKNMKLYSNVVGEHNAIYFIPVIN